MAGDENEARHDASDHGGPPSDLKPVTASAVPPQAAASEKLAGSDASEDPAAPAASTRASEWTVSDSRGPLNAAGSARTIDEVPSDMSSVAAAVERQTDSDSSVVGEPFAAAPPVAPPRRASLWPVAAGVVVGALIGAGSAAYVYQSYGTEESGAALSAVQQKVATLATRVDGLASKPADAQPDLAPLKSALADLATKAAATETTAQAASAKADAAQSAVEKIPAASAPVDSPALGALASKVDSLESAVGALKQQSVSPGDLKAAQEGVDGLKTAVAAVQQQVADTQKRTVTAESDVQALRAGQKSLESRITASPALAVVAGSLVAQVTSGRPFATEVNALESLGVDPAKIAVLRQSADQGVPSAKTLAESFEPLAAGLSAGEHKQTPNASFWDRMKEGAGGLVSVQRVDDVSGDDAPSHVARIRADLAHGDVVAALAVWNTLPAGSRARPADAAWGALAKTHAEAIVAAEAIEHDAIAALGAKKS